MLVFSDTTTKLRNVFSQYHPHAKSADESYGFRHNFQAMIFDQRFDLQFCSYCLDVVKIND